MVTDGTAGNISFDYLLYLKGVSTNLRYLNSFQELDNYQGSSEGLKATVVAINQFRSDVLDSKNGLVDEFDIVVRSLDSFELPSALEEGEIVNQIVNGDLITNDGAIKTVIVDKMIRSKIIHFATHALANFEYPKLSGLLLTSQEQEDPMLYSGEIQNMDLQADLVFLVPAKLDLGRLMTLKGSSHLPILSSTQELSRS